jgi:hypothetical protein
MKQAKEVWVELVMGHGLRGISKRLTPSNARKVFSTLVRQDGEYGAAVIG